MYFLLICMKFERQNVHVYLNEDSLFFYVTFKVLLVTIKDWIDFYKTCPKLKYTWENNYKLNASILSAYLFFSFFN